ncbi:MAG: hypothetical protein J5962_04015 [Lachnospiraceae bacterium]|nr:hypothetical protein [Lachnospiraceae bacterium]
MDNNFNNGFGEPMQPDMSQQYGQPVQPDMNQQYGQPVQPDMNQQYGQPVQPDMSQQYGQPMQPGLPPQPPVNNGGKAKKAKGPKKPLGKGAIAGIIGGGVALIVAIVCGIIFIPKLFKSDKEVVLDAMEATFSASASGDSYFEETFGSSELSDKLTKEGGSVSMDFNIDEVSEISDLAGLSFSIKGGKDNTGKQLGYDFIGTYNDTEVFTVKFYADENTTYLGIPDIINGYFTIPNKGAVDALINSPIGQAANLADSLGSAGATGGDLNYFVTEEDGEVEINSDAVGIIDELWDNVTFEKQGRAKVDVNGETISTKEYYVTLKEEDIETALNDLIDMALSYDASDLEAMGLDEASMQTAISQAKALIPTMVAGDFVLKVYIGDGKIVKMVAADEVNIMGVKITYDCYIDISDDLGGKFELNVMGEAVGVSFDIDDYKTAPNGEIRAYAADEEIKLTLASTATDDDKEKSLDLSMTLYEGRDELGILDMAYALNKGDNSIECTFDLTVDEETLSVEAKGQYVDIVKGESYSCRLDEIKVSFDGEQLAKMSGSSTVSTAKEVPAFDSSLPTYDLTTMTEADFENMILDNADNAAAWMQKLEDCGLAELLGLNEEEEIEEPVEDEGSDDMESVLTSYGDTTIEILGCLPGYEKTYGCEYFIDYDDPDGNVMIEYTCESDTTAETYVAEYEFYDQESIIEQDTNLEVTLSDGSVVKYTRVLVDYYGTEENSYIFAKDVADGCVLVANVRVFNNAATLEEVAEAMAEANYAVH